MGMFEDYKGEVLSVERGRGPTAETLELREALQSSVTSKGFKVIPGTTEKDMKHWANRIRSQAAKIDLGVAMRITVDGQVAFKAHELVEADAAPEPIQVVTPKPRPPKAAPPPAKPLTAGRRRAGR